MPKSVLVFSGRSVKGDPSVEVDSYNLIDQIIDKERVTKLLPERRKNITVVGDKVTYKPTQNYFIARNLFFRPFRRKWKIAGEQKH